MQATGRGETGVSVQAADFDPGLETALLGETGDCGAVVTFVGLVRRDSGGAGDQRAGVAPGVVALELEHYPGMTERSIGDIVAQARLRWPLHGVKVIHRIGRLCVGDRIVFVGIASRHRGDAFAACEFVMDYLKTRAPFWKKQWDAQGNAQWVDARDSDTGAAERWIS